MLNNKYQISFLLPFLLPITRSAPVVPTLHLAQITANPGPPTYPQQPSPHVGQPGHLSPGQGYPGVDIHTYRAHNIPHTVANNMNAAAAPVYAGHGSVYAAPRQLSARYPTSRQDMMDLIPTPGFVALQMMNMGRSMVSDLAYNLSKAMLFMLWL